MEDDELKNAAVDTEIAAFARDHRLSEPSLMPHRERIRVVLPFSIPLGVIVILVGYLIVVLAESYNITDVTLAMLQQRADAIMVGRILYLFGWGVFAFGLIFLAEKILLRLQK